MHAIVATAPIVPALLIVYLVTEHHMPTGRPLLIAIVIALLLCVAVVITLFSRLQLRMLRFVTLIPVVLAVAAVLKLGTVAIDQTLSARPLAFELANMETQPMPLAVYGVPRELEYGLTFYRNQPAARYETGNVPAQEHLLVAPTKWKDNVAKKPQAVACLFLGHYAPQNVDYYWVWRGVEAVVYCRPGDLL